MPSRWSRAASSLLKIGLVRSIAIGSILAYTRHTSTSWNLWQRDNRLGNGRLDAVAAPVLAPARGGRAGPWQGEASGLEMAPQSIEKIDSAPGTGTVGAVAAPVLVPTRGGRAGRRQAEAIGLGMAPQSLEKIDSAPGNGMAARGHAALVSPFFAASMRLTKRRKR